MTQALAAKTPHLSNSAIPKALRWITEATSQKAIPALARDPNALIQVEQAVKRMPTRHDFVQGDSRDAAVYPGGNIHLALTSPPYWTLKEYPDHAAQLGSIADYESFLDQLDKVWTNVFARLVPGGRLAVVVGDVCLARRQAGRHTVYPLHASIQERCRRLGFDNLAPIIWYKIANARYEVAGGGGFLGKPYEPNAVVKNDIEFILFFRKPGGYRRPSLAARILSVIGERDHREWFQQIWRLGGASTRNHPAPFPEVVAERLIRMFSFVGDTVLDPFLGSGTTTLAAARWGRNSVGIDVEPAYVQLAEQRFDRNNGKQLPLG